MWKLEVALHWNRSNTASEVQAFSEELIRNDVEYKPGLGEHLLLEFVRPYICLLVRSFQADNTLKAWIAQVSPGVYQWAFKATPMALMGVQSLSVAEHFQIVRRFLERIANWTSNKLADQLLQSLQ
jgi:hypothetical protein